MVSVSGQGSIKVWAGFKDGFGRVLIRICSGRVLVGVHGGGSRGSSLLLSRVREEIGPRLAKLSTSAMMVAEAPCTLIMSSMS